MPAATPYRVRVGIHAPDAVASKITYALEELLVAAGISHRVERSERAAGWDLFYGVQPPEDSALWMAASPAAWDYFERGGARVERVETLRAAGGWVRVPGYPPAHSPAGAPYKEQPTATGRVVPDLAAAAFFFLARWEEWHAAERDRFGRFPLSASVFGRGLWSLTECPVESYAQVLRRALEEEDVGGRGQGIGSDVGTPHLTSYPLPPAFTIGLSHDIDSVRRWDGRGFARAARGVLRALLRGQIRQAAGGAGEFWSGLHGRLVGQDPHQNLEEIVRREGAAEASSTFFLIVRHGHRWDGTHPAHYQRLLPSIACGLAGSAEIGVHASSSASDVTSLREERERLAALIGRPVCGVRFHILRRGYEALPEVAAAGFEYDSTLGFAEAPGFRAGIARPFRPYDWQRDRPLDLVEIPLAVMDTTLMSPRYLGLPAGAGRERALLALGAARRWGGAAALLWHNDNLPPNSAGGYAALYTDLIEWTRAAGGRVAPLSDLVDEWKQTRAALCGGDE